MQNPHTHERHLEMLKTALGPSLVALLADDDIIEIMLNPDGKAWVDTLSQGKYCLPFTLAEAQRLNIIKLVASFHHLFITEDHPELACELPFAAARFQAWIYPVSDSPTFTIRKKA